MTLAAEHCDDRVRIRAVQALAYIAAYDYPLIKQRVLDVWSSKDSRHVEHLAASWLLEAIVLDGAAADKVTELLWLWSRKDILKRTVAVRAYGTAIAAKGAGRRHPRRPDLRGAARRPRFTARGGALRDVPVGPDQGSDRGTDAVEAGLPGDAGAGGPSVVRISQFRRIAERESDGPYSLLWLLAHDPDNVGASMTELVEIWLLACSDENDRLRSAAWRMLGRWAESCRQYPDLGGTFTTLAGEFEKAAGGDDLARATERVPPTLE